MFTAHLSLLFACLLPALPLAAAEISLVSYRFSDATPVIHLRLSGEIAPDDPERLARQFETLTRCSGPACNSFDGGPRAVVSLSSPGGNYTAGVKLADFFRENIVATVVETGESCASACAVAFLGGSAFWPTGGVGTYVDRVIEPGARLGFHSPYFTEDLAYQAAAAGKLAQLLEVTRLSIADIVATLTRYNVSQQVLDQIIRMGADGFYQVDTPAALYGIRARLPDFDPAALGIPRDAQIRNICARLSAMHYERPLTELPPFRPDEIFDGVTAEGTALRIYDLGDRPLNVSGCGVPAEGQGAVVTSMTLYQWTGGSDDRHLPLLGYVNGTDGGWSTLGYRGGRATDGFVNLGTLNHVLMPLTQDLHALPEAVLAEVRRGRARDAAPVLPRHNRPWPVTPGAETPWSRSYAGEGLHIVEQTGPAHLFDEIAGYAKWTDVMLDLEGAGWVVRSGRDTEAGTSYYWFALKSGNRAATIRIEAPVPAAELTQAQKDLMILVACSTDFEGVHLGCYQ